MVMGLDESDIIDDGCGGGKSLSVCNASCSICLEHVTDNGNRSWAKLQCGHEFHLDCIGSAFNIKGVMQCPNCRKIEKGQWLYGTGRSNNDIVDDWPHDEDLYDLSYSEMFGLGVQWCPIPGFSRLPAFEEGEFPSTAYHDILGQPAVFGEHTAVSSSTHQCPYLAYYGPIHSSSSNSVGSVPDGSNYNNHWGSPSGPSEIPNYAFAAMDPHYHGWEHQSLSFSANNNRLGGSDQPSAPSLTPRPSHVNSELQRSGSYVHPFVVGHSSGGRVGSSATSSLIPPYPGSAARAHDRVQALQAYFQQPSTSPPPPPPMRPPLIPLTRRSSGHLGLSQGATLPSPSDQTAGGFFMFPSGTSNQSFHEAENSISRYNQWERRQRERRDRLTSFPGTQGDREPSWLPQHAAGGSTHRQLNASDRTASHNRS